MTTTLLPDGVLLVTPGAARHYPCGPMQADFLADGAETGDRYSVSIWWVDPHRPGPGPHSHEANEELFYVVEGTMTFQVGEAFVEAPAGTFVRIPPRVTHDFLNRTDARAGALNVWIPGGFEQNMPAIVDWFAAHPDGVAR
jgi:mannose-6-phosphate isomerase-like protein (cupin superfamily)